MVDLEAVIVEALRADSELTGLLGGPNVFTSLPARTPFPCVKVTLIAGGQDMAPWQPAGAIRETLDVQFDCWGGSRSQAATAASMIREGLGATLPGPVAGGAVGGLRFTNTQSLPDDDVPTNNGRARPRYVSQAAITVHHGRPSAPGPIFGPEQSIRATLPTIDEQYPGGVVIGQRYTFTASGSVFGIELMRPEPAGATVFEFSLWSDGGAILHAQILSTVPDAVGWHSVYFATPYAVTPGTPYVISVGCPATTANIRGYCHVDHSTVQSGAIVCSSDGNTWALTDGSTGYPSGVYNVGNDIAMIGPLFAERLTQSRLTVPGARGASPQASEPAGR